MRPALPPSILELLGDVPRDLRPPRDDVEQWELLGYHLSVDGRMTVPELRVARAVGDLMTFAPEVLR